MTVQAFNRSCALHNAHNKHGTTLHLIDKLGLNVHVWG